METTSSQSQWENGVTSRILKSTKTHGWRNKILASQISKEEISSELINTDGFSSEWHEKLKEDLTPILLKTFNWVLTKGKTPASWKEAIILVVPKGNKDKLDQTEQFVCLFWVHINYLFQLLQDLTFSRINEYGSTNLQTQNLSHSIPTVKPELYFQEWDKNSSQIYVGREEAKNKI